MRTTSAIAAIALLALFAACQPERGGSESQTGAAGTFVTTATVTKGEIATAISLTGSIEPSQEIDIVPQIPGVIETIWVKEGDKVSQGQKIAKLETKTAELQLAQAKANVAVAEANFKVASKDWERMQDLYARNSISPQALEKVQLGFESARAQLDQARAARDLAQHQVDISTMKAPFAGVIRAKHLDEGEMISPSMPGGRGVVTLMDISKVEVHVNVSEADIDQVELGRPAEVAVGAGFHRKYQGTITSVDPAADPLSRSFGAVVTVPNGDGQLKAGMYARVSIYTYICRDALIVPEKAVLAEGGQTVAFVVEGDVARRREVTVGAVSQGLMQIQSGISEGDRVVVEGNYGLTDGARVRW